MRRGNIAILALFGPLSASTALADAPFEGRVFIKGSRDPLSQVNLFLLPQKLKTTTDEDGRFRFEAVEGVTTTVVVNAPGFERYEKDFRPDARVPVQIFVSPATVLDYETTIQSSEQKDGVKKTLSQKTAAALPGAGADPIRAVQNLPGVNRSPGFTSQVIIQGSAPQDTRYAIDGHEIPLIFHFGGLSSVFNPDLTESFDYLSAGYQSNYSRAIGGVLNLNSRDIKTRHFKGSAFVDTFNSGAAIETPVGERGHLAVGARISYIGQVLRGVFKNNPNFDLTVAPSYGDLSLIYSRPLNPNLQFKFVSIGSSDSLEFIANNPLRNERVLRGNFSSKIGFFRLIPEFEWTHSERSRTRFSLGLGRDFINTDIGPVFFDLATYQATLRAENRTRVSDRFTLAYGMDHRLTWADVAFKVPVAVDGGGLPNPVSSAELRTASLTGVSTPQFGFYVNPVWKPSVDSPWTFYPGARVDYFAAVSDLALAPRVGARYAVAPDLTLISSGGLYAQPPEERQFSPAFGNPDVKGPRCWQMKVGAEKDFSASLTRGSELYSGVFARWFDNLVITDVAKRFTNDGAGEAYGWENSFRYNPDPWNFWASYTLSRSTRSDPLRGSYLFQFDQTHFLTLIAGVNLGNRWRISTRFRYVTGPLDTIPVGAVGDIDNDVFIPIRGGLFNTRLDAFSSLDLRIDKKWVYDTWNLSLYLDILNTLNRRNQEGIQYSYDYSRSQTVMGLPIIPTFGLKGEF